MSSVLSMLDRIEELLRVRELSSSQFADAIGVSRPVVSHILSGRNKPSLEVVQKIIVAFPDLSLNWLLNATGPMLERPAALQPVQSETVPKPTARPQPAPNPAPAPAVAPAPSAMPTPALATAPVEEPAPLIARERVAAPVAAPEPAPVMTPAPTPVVAPASVSEEPLPTAPTKTPTPPMPAGAEMAYALAEPGKAIRRIVLFYQDGTFADFRPEAGG